MPDKPDPCFALPDQAVIALHGRDALAFAQAQFMNDVAALADGQWQWNGWLTAQGRVIALFVLLRRDAESLWLVLGDAEPTDDLLRVQFALGQHVEDAQARRVGEGPRHLEQPEAAGRHAIVSSSARR